MALLQRGILFSERIRHVVQKILGEKQTSKRDVETLAESPWG
jgi:hypothetical protein